MSQRGASGIFGEWVVGSMVLEDKKEGMAGREQTWGCELGGGHREKGSLPRLVVVVV